MTSRKIWGKLLNRQLAPKSPIFKMAENYHGAQFRMWDQNLNACNLYIVGKEILSGLELGSKTGLISSLLIENRRDVFLKVVAFLLKVAEI